MFKKQGWHFFSLAVLLAAVALLARGDMLTGQLWGISTQVWFWIRDRCSGSASDYCWRHLARTALSQLDDECFW